VTVSQPVGATEALWRADRVDRLERMTNLVLVLLETERPLTIREISDTVAGYPQGEAGRQAFERDKKAIRDLGIRLTIEPVEAATQQGYRIKPEDYYLPDLGLDEAEEQALAFAIAAVQLGGAAGADALAKLGGPVTEAALSRAGLGTSVSGPGVAPVAVLPSLPQLGPIHEGLRRKALLRFKYHGRQRQVEPYGLTFRQGAWYLVGRDRSAEGGAARRTFRVDRFESVPQVGEGGEFEPPAGYDLRDAVRLMPWSQADGADDADDLPVADLVVDVRMARVVASQAPGGAVVGWLDDGSVRLKLLAGDLGAFVSFVAGLGDTAVVEGPAELRDAVVGRLEELAGPLGVEPPPPPADPEGVTEPGVEPLPPAVLGALAPGPTDPAGGGTGSTAPAASSRSAQAPRFGGGGVMAGERLRRLLAILVYLARVGEADLAEVAARFSIGEEELVHELELAACCGVPPYSPDQLIELYVDGDRVFAEQLRMFARPQRLTPEEGFVLAAAARALLSVPGADAEGALLSALGKLEAALGTERLAVEIEEPAHLRALQESSRTSTAVEIDYFSSAATAPSTRQVDPYQVVLREGRWYLDGWCHSAGGLRRFQVDRVQAVRVLERRFEVPAGLDEHLSRPGAFLGGPDAVKAEVVFPAGAELAVEQVAVGPIEPAGPGRLRVHILVGDAEGWFARLLCRLGPGTDVLSPPQLRDAGRKMARRALANYRRSDSEGVPAS
jgi:predicted DNA-binding transcriptional regulator YafY